MPGIIEDLGIAIFVAALVGYVTHRLKQPIIVGYLIAGIIIGPEIGPSLVVNPANIEIISEIGIILLLFILGLELNASHIGSLVKKIYLPGIGQFILTATLGVFFFVLFGYSLGQGSFDALYLAIAVSLSSTAIVVKQLYDKVELDSVAGRITIGILIFQDLWAILVLAIQPSLRDPSLWAILLALLKSFFLVVMGFLFSRYVLKKVFESVGKSAEMVISLSIAWCVFLAGIAHLIGLTVEMGALVAGMAIASFPYSIHVTAKVLPLRDFFLILFFISLGMKIPYPQASLAWGIPLLLGFVLITRLITIIPLSMISGSNLRNSFIAGINLTQISEFSLVIASIGYKAGHIHKDIITLILYAMSVAAVASSYLIKYNYQIVHFVEKLFIRFTKREFRTATEIDDIEPKYSIYILGFHRGAKALLELISHSQPTLLEQICVVDFNVEVLRELKSMQIKGFFGDISSKDTLEHLHLGRAQIIISTIPDVLLRGTNNLQIVKICRELNPDAYIIATADLVDQSETLKIAGANEVVLPYFQAASYISEILTSVCAKENKN